MKNWARRLLAGTLCLFILYGIGFAMGEAADTEQTEEILEDASAPAEAEEEQSEEETVKYIAMATVTLKVRREPDKDSLGNGSIEKDGLVYIIELGDEWCLVDTGRNTGYVLTKYLTNIREFTGSETETGDTVTVPEATAVPDTSGNTPDTFENKFVAYTIKSAVARSEMDERSSAAFRIDQYEKLTVGAVYEDWCYVKYKNSYGYIRTSVLFKWDRIDPYAGDIPGCTVHIGLAFVNHSTDIRSYEDKSNEVLKTVNPGSALAVDTADGYGRYPLAYWRTTGYINEEDIGYFMAVVPWEDAESGDLISCMSTYYALGISTLQYRGRNWNIYLGTSFISGTVVQPGETVSVYDLIGPFRRSTGYHRAPIMSPTALSGYGGGTCQVNTTLYNALIQVPIYIDWRKVHAEVGIYYCPVGFDAAIGGGDINMIFTNTLPYAFRINFFMSDGCLTVGLFKV